MELEHNSLASSTQFELMDFQSIQSKSDALECPRCHSLNTKFCYYNNYNYSQPRHFCKTCRRYWTLGGLLRNVPVGGGTRRSKKNPKPKPAIVRESPCLHSNSNSIDLDRLSSPLKLNQAGFDAGIVAAAERRGRGEGLGLLDHLPASTGGSEGMVDISGGVAVGDGGSWFKFYGLTTPFNN